MSDLIRFLTDNVEVPNPTDQTFYTRLGKQAAEGLVEHKTDMNETIAKLAAEHSLNEDQTRRVVEAANNAAFGSLFKKEAGYVTFPVADFQQIRTREQKVKVAAERPFGIADTPTEVVAEQLFGEGCLEKVAEEEPPADPVDITHQARHAADQVEDAHIDALKKLAALQDIAAQLVEDEEAGQPDIQRALQLQGHDEKLAKLACVKVPQGAGREACFSGEVLVDADHPLLKTAAEFIGALETYVVEKQAFAGKAEGFKNVLA